MLNEEYKEEVLSSLILISDSCAKVYLKLSDIVKDDHVNTVIKVYDKSKFYYALHELLVYSIHNIPYLKNIEKSTSFITLCFKQLIPFRNLNSTFVKHYERHIGSDTTPDYSVFLPDICAYISENNLFQLLLDITYHLCILKNNSFIHTDIKPTNILQYYESTSSSLRFFLNDYSHAILHSKFIKQKHNVSIDIYRAPEIYKYTLDNKSKYDYGIDVWSLFITITEIVFNVHIITTMSNDNITKQNDIEIQHTLYNIQDNKIEYSKYIHYINMLNQHSLHEKITNLFIKTKYKHKEFLLQLLIKMSQIDPINRITCHDLHKTIMLYCEKHQIKINTQYDTQYDTQYNIKTNMKIDDTIHAQLYKKFIKIATYHAKYTNIELVLLLEILSYNITKNIIDEFHDNGYLFIEYIYITICLNKAYIYYNEEQASYILDIISKIDSKLLQNFLHICCSVITEFNALELNENQIKLILQNIDI